MPARFNLNAEYRIPAEQLQVYQRGAVVNGKQTNVTSILCHAGHDITAGCKFIYAMNRTTISTRRVFVAAGGTDATHVVIGTPFSFPDKALLINLGTGETAATQVLPDGTTLPPIGWNGSPVAAYKDPNGDVAWPLGRVPMETGGEAGFWANATDLWAISMDNGLKPIRVYILQGQIFGGSGTALPASGSPGQFFVLHNPVLGVNGDIRYCWLADDTGTYHWEEDFRVA